MNPEIKAKWIAALRSGEYKQGSGELHSVNRVTGTDAREDYYCCLGVLCDLAVKDGVDVAVGEGMFNVIYDGAPNVLPDSVRDWAGLDDNNPEPAHRDHSLAELNDGDDDEGRDGLGFEEIANIIEEGF